MILFIVGIVFGGLVSWVITHGYYVKAGSEQREELDKLKSELKPRNTLQDFERYIDESNWRKTYIDDKEVWVCEDDNTFQIHEGDRTRDFSERWTAVHPDLGVSTCPVYLRIGNTTIKELHFVVGDGARIFVPMTERRPSSDGEFEFFWNVNSLEVRVCRIVGSYYIYESLEGVAERSKVAIVGDDTALLGDA